ncbi:glycosyltransferase family 4 protein [Haladaptatus sp. T7]|uniref:glycosyltransferase family 4 protein n=1 Tax=Haladaptatus sp. T7 TaxID=2029368 RepID=UPI0021A25875|nr:glycosyltransferase family 4 protein [Haladaptatus sp. T7]GKZ14585.1 glycosyl transferase [Haladaptatus sp. T7]
MTSVCILTTVHTPFDTRIFHKQARTLVDAGYEVELLCHHDEDTTKDGIRITTLGTVDSRVERWSHLVKIYQMAIEADADVYHFHDPELLTVGILLSLRTDSKVVYDVHEDYADAIRVREWIPDEIKPVLARGFPQVQSQLARAMDSIVTADLPTANQFVNRGHDSVVTVRNFPRLENIEFGEVDGENDSEYTLSYVGGLDSERGLQRMLKLTHKLRQRDIDVTLRLIGPFQNDDVERKAKSYIRRHDLESAVELLGYVDYEDMFAYLYQSDLGLVLVDTARFERNVPTKMFEYMYAELPVVATKSGSTERYLDSDYSIFVSESLRESDVDAVTELLRDEEKRSEMGDAGRQRVVDEYCWEEEKANLVELYDELTH